jgi:hypothetical protein
MSRALFTAEGCNRKSWLWEIYGSLVRRDRGSQGFHGGIPLALVEASAGAGSWRGESCFVLVLMVLHREILMGLGWKRLMTEKGGCWVLRLQVLGAGGCTGETGGDLWRYFC